MLNINYLVSKSCLVTKMINLTLLYIYLDWLGYTYKL